MLGIIYIEINCSNDVPKYYGGRKKERGIKGVIGKRNLRILQQDELLVHSNKESQSKKQTQIKTKPTLKEGFAFAHCTCKAPYHLRVHDAAVIASLAYLVYLIDGYQQYWFRLVWGFDSEPSFYCICGALLFFVLLGLSGCFITCYDRRVRNDLAQLCREICLCCCHPGDLINFSYVMKYLFCLNVHALELFVATHSSSSIGKGKTMMAHLSMVSA
ncbi:hypothetical protein Ahy_B08g092011 [Arachis hypogaea]|uniref:Uncharacterized protein n=1 Tax=Arachis hypogaea TaxID=3818 RepID=A0A444Y2Z2_ARAHY|nr:hypothetical protein Ahy_B08g092011 [Arachis hypogaea]